MSAPLRRHVPVALMVASVVLSPLASAAPPRWPDTPLARTQVLALLQSLNADLLSHPSATLTLEHWCQRYRMASPARIVAMHGHGSAKPLPPEMRKVLRIDAATPVKYRRVRLACGSHVLSEADNWYVPSRLTPAMNHTLETTEAPFGKVVRPLHFSRKRLSSQLLWSPLPAGWAMQAPPASQPQQMLAIPEHLLRHRAVLLDDRGRPISLVVETYTRAVLDIPPQAGVSGR